MLNIGIEQYHFTSFWSYLPFNYLAIILFLFHAGSEPPVYGEKFDFAEAATAADAAAPAEVATGAALVEFSCFWRVWGAHSASATGALRVRPRRAHMVY